MTKIAFFGHDVSDSAIRRRVQSFIDDGLTVQGFMMRRGEGDPPDWDNVELGQTFDGQFIQRFKNIFKGASIAAAPRNGLDQADIIYARNLDMLACAFQAKRKAGLDTPVIYECLDVHRLLTRDDPVGIGMRALEGQLLKRTKALVVSSPAFLREHFERYYAGQFNPILVENRMAAHAEHAPRPASGRPLREDGKLVLGWLGILRCQRSFDLMLNLADRFPGQLEIRLHGKPARTEISSFEPEIETRPNITYFGPYKAPEDLGALYQDLDLVWAGDFMEAGYNSVWLLPNRLYEGGYFAVPPLVVNGTQTEKWASERGIGFGVSEPLETSLEGLISELIEDRSLIADKRALLLKLPEATFVQPMGVFAGFIEDIL